MTLYHGRVRMVDLTEPPQMSLLAQLLTEYGGTAEIEERANDRRGNNGISVTVRLAFGARKPRGATAGLVEVVQRAMYVTRSVVEGAGGRGGVVQQVQVGWGGEPDQSASGWET